MYILYKLLNFEQYIVLGLVRLQRQGEGVDGHSDTLTVTGSRLSLSVGVGV